jgi:hypothetical protein
MEDLSKYRMTPSPPVQLLRRLLLTSVYRKQPCSVTPGPTAFSVGEFRDR